MNLTQSVEPSGVESPFVLTIKPSTHICPRCKNTNIELCSSSIIENLHKRIDCSLRFVPK